MDDFTINVRSRKTFNTLETDAGPLVLMAFTSNRVTNYVVGHSCSGGEPHCGNTESNGT